MIDLRSGVWRYQETPLTESQAQVAVHVPTVGWMVPDDRLQAITDAWDGYLVSVDGLGENEAMAWYEVACLLEALTEENR